MPTYVSLINFTDQGIRNVKDTLDRSERAAKAAEKYGARFEQIYWTVGPTTSLLFSKRPMMSPPPPSC
jgi:uncharacterized protein with GYD domain